MEPGPAQGTPAAPAPERKQGWLTRLPLWARVVIPIVLLAGVAVVVAALLPRQPADPADAAESVCRSGVLAELESHDMTTREVSFYEVTTTDEDVYLARGDVAFSENDGDGDGAGDGAERRIDLRCTVRVENGEMQAPSIRYSEPITAD
jgi:hypothetical protein